MELIYKRQSLPQDKRFLPTDEGGVFKYFSVSDLVGKKEDRFYSLVEKSEKVIGLGELEKNPYEEGVFWIKCISIDPEYRGKGNASKLAREMFKFAKEKGVALESSSSSQEGFEKLKPLFNKLSEEYSVEFTDTERIIP